MNHNTDLSQSIGQTVQVIGFGRRLVAYLIDIFILSIVSGVAGGGIGFITALLSGADEDVMVGVNIFIQCFSLLIGAGYFIIFWATTGQTLGKMAMGIKIINTNGSSLTFGKAILRYVGYIISSIPFSLGFVWAGFDARRQGWHDKIAGTYVVQKDTHFTNTDSVTLVPSDSKMFVIVAVVLAYGLMSIFLIFGLLLVFASSSGVAPFIYTLF